MAERDDFSEGSHRPGGVVPARDFALLYHVTPGRVCQMLRAGDLPGQRINGRWFVYVSESGRKTIERMKDYLQRPREVGPVEEEAGDEEIDAGAPTLLETCVNLLNYWRAKAKAGRVRWEDGDKALDAFLAEALFQDAEEAIKTARGSASDPPPAKNAP